MQVIHPTIGRVVWFQTDYDSQPKAALVAFVHNDRLVNLGGFDASGQPFAATSVVLKQPNDPQPEFPFAMWMPYQVAQAERA